MAYEDEARFHLGRRDLAQTLHFMAERGSSLALNWGEDLDPAGTWEADWITGGARFRGVSKDPLVALHDAIRAAYRGIGVNV